MDTTTFGGEIDAGIDSHDRASAGWASQSALITGASQGLGKAFAAECARMGMDLLLVALPNSGLHQVSQELSKLYGVRSECVAMDLTAPDGPEMLFRWVSDLGSPVTMLINNAGVSYNSRFEDMTLHESENCILLNNLALVKITHLFLPELRKHKEAFVLNVASLAAFFTMPFVSVYAPSKAFVLHFSLALREEMRQTPVRVSVLCPNGIHTNQEVRERIAAHGLISRLTCMDAQPVAAHALRKLRAGKAVIVPGFLNRVCRFLGQCAPHSATTAFVSALYRKTARKKRRRRKPARELRPAQERRGNLW